jgi:hypothetical protein
MSKARSAAVPYPSHEKSRLIPAAGRGPPNNLGTDCVGARPGIAGGPEPLGRSPAIGDRRDYPRRVETRPVWPRRRGRFCPEAALPSQAKAPARLPLLSDRPDPLLGPALLRTGLAPFNASGSSKPRRSDSNYVLRSAPGSGAGRPQVHSPRPMAAASSPEPSARPW